MVWKWEGSVRNEWGKGARVWRGMAWGKGTGLAGWGGERNGVT